jgi:2-methylcitrate dehydratase PrpD
MEGNARGHGEAVTLARELVRAARAAAGAPLPEDVATAARLHFLDAIGVGLAAAGSPIGAPTAPTPPMSPGRPGHVLGQPDGGQRRPTRL